MSPLPISHSPDLLRLRAEGYDLGFQANHLVLRNVPYVNAHREVKRGMLVSELTLAGNVTTTPSTHVIMFAGEYPCDVTGVPIENIRHGSARQVLGPELVVEHSFSSKPDNGYKDYYEKLTTYATIISSPAAALDPSATAKIFPVILPEEDDVFAYLDTASSRAGISLVATKVTDETIAIVGLGGTGSYILDLVAKTPVRAIHLYDADRFLQHNAFRAPGAASLQELRQAPTKVRYLADRYAHMHRHIIPHEYHIDAGNAAELQAMSMVFLALDKSEPKRAIIATLEERGIPFIDVGMGVNLVDGALHGVLRITTSTTAKRAHVAQRIPLGDDVQDEYDQNIQIADLNALNAALAVIKWKKLRGCYQDLEHEHHTTYTTDGNFLTNEDQA